MTGFVVQVHVCVCICIYIKKKFKVLQTILKKVSWFPKKQKHLSNMTVFNIIKSFLSTINIERFVKDHVTLAAENSVLHH